MKIAFMGDSITEGIGSQKINYANFLKEKVVDSEINNFALTGTTIKYGHKRIMEVKEFNPDIIIISYGNVDAMPRPIENIIYNILPSRYKGLGMLDPRALYTKKNLKRIFQKTDSYIRYNIKKILISIFGYSQWVNIEEFEYYYRLMLDDLKILNKKCILVSTVPMENRYFPYANMEYQKYNQVIKNLSMEYNFVYIDLYNELKKYPKREIFLKDLFHPNKMGYKKISELIYEKL